MERFDVLMRVSVDHAVYKWVFAVLKFDVLGGFHLVAGESDVEGDVISAFVQYVPFQDLQLWSVIFPSKPRVSLWPFVGASRRASCS